VAADAATFNELKCRLADLHEKPAKALIVQAGVDYPEHLVI
jgi:hypothetical protein